MSDSSEEDSEVVRRKARRATAKLNEQANQLELELVRFRHGDTNIDFNVDVTHETVWATQQQIADLFQRDKSAIGRHIANVLDEGELEAEAVVAKIATTASDGKTYEIAHYDLDMILAVGFRVRSPKASEFRKWAYKTLRAYIVDGYALNEARLRSDPGATNELAAKLRAIRAEEKSIYASVRAFFKEGSSDYDPKSKACGSFYAQLQDRFHFAVTQKTASQIIMDRADHRQSNMGLQTFTGNMPKIEEAKIAKNYLDGDELYTLHILCEQFLLYVQSKAVRGQKMTMVELSVKLDELMRVNDYPVFSGYKDYLRDRAIKHAQAEYALFWARLARNEPKRVIPTRRLTRPTLTAPRGRPRP